MSQFASEKLLWTCADLIFSKHSLSTVCSYKAVLIFPFFTFLAKCIMFLVSLFKSLGNGKSIQAPAWSSAHVIWKTAFILNGNILQAFTGSQNYLEGRYEEMRIKAFWSVLASETKNEFCHLIFFFFWAMKWKCWQTPGYYDVEMKKMYMAVNKVKMLKAFFFPE